MSATHGGKGSRPRQSQVDQKKFADNWDLAFGKKEEPKEKQDDDKSSRED